MHVGIGYDVHRLSQGARLILGGVEIPHELGLVSWTDGDVLIHAVIDALLGASGEGDIGLHFPPGSPSLKGVSSLTLLGQARDIVAREGWQVNNVDTIIVAESPRLASFIDGMRHNLARVLGIDVARVNVKASSTEGLGFIGREEGMAAWAVVTVKGNSDKDI